MKNFRKKVNNVVVYLLAAAMLLTMIPETAVQATGAAEPESLQLETEQPEAEQPLTEQPETEQPVTEQSGIEQPEAEQSETEQPEAKQSETTRPETEKPEEEKSETKQQATDGELSPEELYEIDGGDAEYWKHYDAEGNRIINEEVQTYSSAAALSGLTLNSPFTSNSYSILSGYQVSHAIDVSKYNNENDARKVIDWNQVKADGIDSVIIRCGNRGYGSAGTLMTDPYFETNIEDALAAGLKVGIYIYSQAITSAEAVEEANHCLTLCINYLDRLDLPIVMDAEYANPGGQGLGGRLYDANLTKTQQTAICKAFCKTIEDAGYQAMVYANKSFLTDEMYPSQLTDAGYQVWLARYNDEAGYSASPYIMWQYSSTGSVSGITGDVDVNFLYTSSQADAAPKWDTPSVVNGAQVNLSWTTVTGAEGYEIERSTDQTTWSRIKTLDAAAAISCTDETVAAETTYYYRIRTYYTENGTKKYGSWSDTVSATTSLKTPPLKGAQVLSSQSVKLTWSSVPQAENYQVYRKNAGGTWDLSQPVTTIASSAAVSGTLSFTDQSVTAGETYCYTVRAYYTLNGEVHYSQYDTNGIQVKVVPAEPKLGSVTASDYKTLKITWGKVTGADGYRVYRKVSGGSWTAVSDVSNSTTSYTNGNVDTGTTYYYAVSAYFLKGTQKIEGSHSNTGISGKTIPATPKLGKVTSVNYKNLKVTWSGVSRASGYRIYRKESGGGWKYLADVKSSARSFTDGYKITTGKKYYYSVRAYRTVNGSRVYGKYNTTGISGKAIPSTPSVTLKSTQKGKVKISWKKVSGASGYVVYRKSSSGGKWTSIKTITSGSTTSYIASAASKKTYYYTVRAYRKVGSKRIYSNCKENLKIKVK